MSGLYNTPLTENEKRMFNEKMNKYSRNTRKINWNSLSNKVFEYNVNKNQVSLDQNNLSNVGNLNVSSNVKSNKLPNGWTKKQNKENTWYVSPNGVSQWEPPTKKSTPNVSVFNLQNGWTKKQNKKNTWYVSPNGVSQWETPIFNYNTAIKKWQGNVASGKINVSRNVSRKKQTKKEIFNTLTNVNNDVNLEEKYKVMANYVPDYLSRASYEERIKSKVFQQTPEEKERCAFLKHAPPDYFVQKSTGKPSQEKLAKREECFTSNRMALLSGNKTAKNMGYEGWRNKALHKKRKSRRGRKNRK